MTKTLRLKYLPADEVEENTRAQPCVVKPKNGEQPYRVVPVAPIIRQDCIGCVGENDPREHYYTRIDCAKLPACGDAVYVRATPANKLKHIAWLLEQH